MSRLEENSREITWTESARITIGYGNCGVCELETPKPTMDRMVEFAKSSWLPKLMWPSTDVDGCHPPGWEWDHNEAWLCPECVAAKNAAFAARRKD